MVRLALVLAMSPWGTVVGGHGAPDDTGPPVEAGDDDGNDGDEAGEGPDDGDADAEQDEGPSSLRDDLPHEERLAEASAAFGRGVRAYKNGEFDVAVEEFSRAQQLAPHPDTLFNLALAQQGVGDHVAAWRSLDALLDDAEDEQEREDILSAQGTSRPHVAWFRVQTQSEGVVCFDGQRMPPDDEGVPQVLTTPGAHRLDIGRAYRPIELSGGEQRTLEIDVPPPQPPPLPRRRLRVLAGLSIAGVSAAAGLGLGAGLTQQDPLQLGLGLGAAGAGTLALTTSIAALVVHRRNRRWTPPPPLRRCPP